MPQDPLRQFFTIVDDVRSNIDSMISQGTRQVKATLPQLPFPGAVEIPAGLPKGPGDILDKLPKLPGLPTLGTEKKTEAPTPTPPNLRRTPTIGEGTGRSMQRQVPLRPLNHVGIGRRF